MYNDCNYWLESLKSMWYHLRSSKVVNGPIMGNELSRPDWDMN